MSYNNDRVQAFFLRSDYNNEKGFSIAPTMRFKNTEGSFGKNFEFLF